MNDRPVHFLHQNDKLAHFVNEKANDLLNLLQKIKMTDLEARDENVAYFFKHHLNERIYFSIKSSASIIYNAVLENGSVETSEIVIVDYGAGLGTLFLLAGLCDFKHVIYNDFDRNWTEAARYLAQKLSIKIDYFVTGTIDQVVIQLDTLNTKVDIVVSRNVLEHIYDIKEFHIQIFAHNPNALVYSSTTANYQNFAMRFLHWRIHKKAEKTYLAAQRKTEIRIRYPQLQEQQISDLVRLTKGKAFNDFENAIKNYLNGKILKVKEDSNTCNCITGLWIEHLLSEKQYKKLAVAGGFNIKIASGFWDTHYKYPFLNLFSRTINLIIKNVPDTIGKRLSPFICVIAKK